MSEILNFRAIYKDEKVKFFSKNSSFILGDEVSFDSDFKENTSIELFVGGIVSAVIFTLKKGLTNSGIKFDDLECASSVILENSLSFLGVIGYNEKPEISKINLKIYIYTELEFNELSRICNEILQKSFILNTLKNIIKFKISQIA